MGGRTKLVATLAALALIAAGPAHAAGKCQIGKFAEFPTTMVGMRAHVTVQIDGHDTTFTVDSGSFVSIMNRETVHQLKLETFPAPMGYYVHGLGGVEGRVDVAKVGKLGLAGVEIPNVPFLVLPEIANGTAGVLGQNVLGAMDTEYDFGNGMIRLMHPSPECDHANLAYWAGSQSIGVVDLDRMTPESPHLRGEAKLNGQVIHVEFDTGSPFSFIKLSTAERVGFRPDGPGVQASGVFTGVGGRVVESWLAPFESLAIGGEQIKNTRLRVSGVALQQSDMLLGADFFLSHRIYVSKQQRKLYFTYNGGPVFQLGRPAVAVTEGGAPVPAAGDGPDKYADTPTDAAGFVRRGQASLSRRDYAAAIADFTRASDLDPKNPEYFRLRAQAHLGQHQLVLAMADVDEALKLKPGDSFSLLERGSLYLGSGDEKRAAADFAAAIAAEPEREFGVASIYSAAGRYEAAIGHFDAWMAAHPKSERMADALNGRCRARTLWGRELDKALADCELAVRRGPHVAALFDSRGLVHLRRGEFDLAIADYNEALKLQPKLAWALYGRGLARLGKGLTADGEADLAAASAIAPNLAAEARKHGIDRPGAASARAGA